MKVHDRYSGEDIELPARVEPGRYRLLASAVLNGEVKLSKGHTLWSDGGELCAFEGEQLREFVQPRGEPKDGPSEQLIDEAVQAVIDAWTPGPTTLPSPVLPPVLGDIVEPTELEMALQRVLSKGHLHVIATRPRMAMRYERELLPLSRARRVARGAVVRLASHSQDWLRRELSGVTPRALLAEVSEDDVSIYENIVFARLLDRLADMLRKRLQDVEAVQAKQTKAAALSHAEQLDFRLRTTLCGLWGLSFDAAPAAAEIAQTTLLQIEEQLRKVQQLRHCALYGAIAPTQRVALQLRTTNVLMHDQHYRHLRTLWLLAHAAGGRHAPSARERFEAERTRGAQFSRYVELLARHALAQIKLVRSVDGDADRFWFGHLALHLRCDADDWVLSLDGTASPLRIIAARRGGRPWQPHGERHVVFCHQGAHDQGDELRDFGASGVLHPLEFYGVERIRQIIEHWLYRGVLSHLPARLRRLPTQVCEQILAAVGASARADGQDLVFDRPLDGVQRAKLDSAIQMDQLNDVTRKAIANALNNLQLFATCRLCGRHASGRDVDADRSGMRLVCRDCGLRWSLQILAKGASKVSYSLATGTTSFEEVGTLAMKIRLLD